MIMNRPYVIINCAMSADGKIALPNGKQFRISSEEDIARVHRLRNSCDAILVGIETILNDDPKLTVKEKYVEKTSQPTRIILDTYCRTPVNALAVKGEIETLIITSDEIKYDKKYGGNVEIISCSTTIDGFIDLEQALYLLYKKGIKTLLVEGGGTVIWSFLREKLVDELYIYIGSIIIGGIETPTPVEGKGFLEEHVLRLELLEYNRLGDGVLLHYRLIRK